MDIPRARTGTRRRYVIGAAAALVLLVATAALARMAPSAPRLDGASVWTDTVKRGTMLREVRGPGTLVSEQVRWISAQTAGRVEQILVQPGVTVAPGTPLLVLSNADVQRDALEAQRQLVGAEAERSTLSATLENQRLSQEAAVATVRAEQREAARQAAANRELAERGLISRMDLERSEDRAEELASRLRVEEQRLRFLGQSMRQQLAAQQSQIDRLRGLAEFQNGYVQSMRVMAGTDGVLRELPLQEGQWVTVDVALEGELPRGARPDLSVDGVIEIERIPDVLYLDRPAYGQAGGTLGMFKVEPGGRTAARTSVRLGRSSVNTVEVLSGLREGDVVIISDMTAWDGTERVRLR